MKFSGGRMCFLTWSLVTFCRTRLSVLMMIPESGSGKRRAPCEKKKRIGDCNLHSILRIRHACEEGKLSAEEEEGGGMSPSHFLLLFRMGTACMYLVQSLPSAFWSNKQRDPSSSCPELLPPPPPPTQVFRGRKMEKRRRRRTIWKAH